MELIIIHITDIHIKREEDLDILMQRTDSIVGAISEVIRNAKKTLLLFCVTGDIAFSGKENQYIIAEIFFDDIFEKIRKRYRDLDIHFAFVPGNHDCDFASEENTVRTTIIKSNELNMNDENTMKICTSIQRNCFSFIDYYVKKDLTAPIRNNSIFTQNIVINKQLGEYNIKIHCLNTAWCSLEHETKDMIFKVPEAIDEKGENDIVITLMHHGDNWFNWEGEQNWEKYHKKFCDIILVGHDHSSKFVHETNYDNASNYFIKGNQFYSTEEPTVSGFNIFKVNLDDDIEFFYTYEWNEKLYKRIIDSKAQHFEKNKFLKSKISLVGELRDYLEDIEIDITSKYKSHLSLSDVYVFPVLRGEKVNNSNKIVSYRGKDNIINIIQTQKKILIDGSKEYGKTALIKRLFMIFYTMNMFPIIINVDDIKSSDEDKINSLIRDTYQNSYDNLNIDEIMQMEKEKKVCFIDNFDLIILSDKSQKSFLEYINNQFDIVILSSNGKNCIMDTVKNLESNEYINDTFYKLEIKALRSYGKNKIIEKWLLLEDSEQDINSQEFDVKRRNKLGQMKSVIKNGYFSNTPLEFLLVLSYIDNSDTMNADYSRYSYIYDCLIRDKINNISNKDTKSALAYKTLLEILAYSLYLNEINVFFDEEYLFRAIADYNENYTSLRETSTKIIQKLIQHKIIEEKNNKYKFRYNYMYYYFAGSYIVDILSPTEKEIKTLEILSDLSKQINYNIAIFMAYSMNAEHEILPKVKSICAGLLQDYEEFKYEDQRELLSKINSDILEKLNEIYKIPENSEIPEIQENKQIQQDEIEEQIEIEKGEERVKNNVDIIFSDFTKLLRLIEFQGDILKNYATKISNEPRKEIIGLMGKSNLKLIGFLCNRLSYETDKIIEIVDKKAKENNSEKATEKGILLSLIKDYLNILWSHFIELNVNNLSNCWECDLIQEDIIEYKEKMQSAFFDMVNIEYSLKITDNKLPISDIENSLNGRRKLDSFSMRIMKDIIASYLCTYQYDSKDKERICKLLGFNYKYLFIEDQKASVLGLEV